MKKIILYISLCVICAMSYISWRLHILPPPIQKFMGCYGLHASGVLGLTTFYGFMFNNMKGFSRRLTVRQCTIIGLVAVIVATLNEMGQYFEPGRVVDVWDVVAQCVGGLVGVPILILLQRVK